ncbi:T9SS type A sorting domain-containing protein [Aurantibacillus circumpalustris]|uniref:T9SS type A sorting domain-containing protein n=1 Tax=Aurantibacillus circumpalustris TaxID=3036359 RepID=UPI00295AEADC|nr:T9SS type A sorting domain-containing protein [Aurantibacillus circumpalustris]
MKKILPSIFFLILFFQLKSQVVFCPVGAEWSYEFSGIIFSPSVYNNKIKCTGSYFDGNDTIKTLVHDKFYLFCNESSSITTLIKQRGDTVYFSNARTQNTWQILYNFASQTSQGWQTTILQHSQFPATFYYVVDSVKTVQINGFNLRRLYINNGASVITERFGSSGFLFNFPNSDLGLCDGDYFHEFLCYTDLSFGTKQFSAKPCDFSNTVGFIESNETKPIIQIFPNPSTNKINVQIENLTNTGEYEFQFVDLLGQKNLIHKTEPNENNSFEIDISSFKTGIYFLQVFQNNELITNQKVIKE